MTSSIPKREAEASTNSSSRAWETLKPPLAEWIIDAVTSMGLKRMTPVQASAIPLFMAHKDVVVEAVTGSGKTLAFLIPVVERLLRLEEPLKKHHIGAIVISPTRELTIQINGVLQSLLAFHPPSASAIHNQTEVLDESDPGSNLPAAPVFDSSARLVVAQLLVGGDTTPAQDLSCFLKRSPNLLISTPGRLLELLSSPHVHCPQSSFEVLVMDEADRLLDLGFKEDLRKILGRLPKQRRTGLFSASMSEAVDQLIRVGLRNPVKVAVKVKSITGGEDRRTPSSLQMSYIVSPASQKLPTIGRILSSLKPLPTKTIIYLSTCAAVDYFQHVILPILPLSEGQPYNLFPLHGKHPAKVREKNFAAFTNSIMPAILLTTDVAARGLDIPQVDLVVQIDPPIDPKVFLHRCGRAGRAGRRGVSVIFLQPGREEDYLRFLDVRKTPLTPLSLSNMEIRPDEVQAATTIIRGIVLSDRALHDKAQRGFVSWVKAYSKHQASSIFRVTDLDWEDLGRAWGLLKLPKMPELKNWQGEKGLGLDIDFSSYTYKDKQREQNRRQELEARRAQVKIDNGTTNAQHLAPPLSSSPFQKKTLKRAWSDKLDQHAVREKRREKRGLAREHRLWAAMTPAEQEKKRELERMIEQVKRDRAVEEAEGEFEGFED